MFVLVVLKFVSTSKKRLSSTFDFLKDFLFVIFLVKMVIEPIPQISGHFYDVAEEIKSTSKIEPSHALNIFLVLRRTVT